MNATNISAALLFLCLGLTGKGWAQRIDYIAPKTGNAPLFIIMSPLPYFEDLHQQIESRKEAFYLVEESLATPTMVMDSLNELLNSSYAIDKQRVYAIYLTKSYSFGNIDVFNDDFIAKKCWWKLNEIPNEDAGEAIAMHYPEQSLEEVIEKMKKEHTWDFTLSQIKKNHTLEHHRKSSYWLLGLTLGGNFPRVENTEAEIPSNYIGYGLTLSKRISPRWSADLQSTFSYKSPDAQEQMQQAVQSQIDPSAMMSGEEVTIHLDQEMEFRFAFALSVGMTHYFRIEKRLQPYIGAGLGITSYMGGVMEIDTTITIDPSIASMGGGFGGGGGAPDPQNAEGMGRFNHPFYYLKGGLSYKLGNKVYASATLDYSHPMVSAQSERPSMANIAVWLGLQFKLQKRSKRFTQYLRIRD